MDKYIKEEDLQKTIYDLERKYNVEMSTLVQKISKYKRKGSVTIAEKKIEYLRAKRDALQELENIIFPFPEDY